MYIQDLNLGHESRSKDGFFFFRIVQVHRHNCKGAGIGSYKLLCAKRGTPRLTKYKRITHVPHSPFTFYASTSCERLQ